MMGLLMDSGGSAWKAPTDGLHSSVRQADGETEAKRSEALAPAAGLEREPAPPSGTVKTQSTNPHSTYLTS